MNSNGIDEKGLGAQLSQARRTAGLTQQDLCSRAGLSYSTLAKIERGAIKSPSIFTIQQIAGVLGTSLDELVGTPPALPATKKTSRSGVSFVYFDINGCLVRFFHRAFTKLSEDTGAPPDVVETTFWHYNDAVCRGEMPLEEFNKVFAEQLGVRQIDWQAYYFPAIDPIDEMRELLAWAATHYQVGLLSNIMPGFINTLRSRGMIPEVRYAAIIDSSEAGAIKPEQKMYEIAQARAGCPPESILLVDDSRTNLMAAEKLGWHVLWFDDYRPQESAERVRATLEFE